MAGLHPTLDFATIVCVLGAITSWLRGGRPRALGDAQNDLGVDVLSAADAN